MTLMDKEFDLIVETSLEDINNWLLSVAFELSEDYIQVGYSQDSGWAIVDNPIIHPPGGDVHSHRFSASCTWHSKRHFEIRDSRVEVKKFEDIMHIDIRRLSDKRVQLIGYVIDMVGRSPLIEIKERTIQAYSPDIIFDFEKMRTSFHRPDFDYMGETIFDFVIESTALHFGNWVDRELARLYPGVFTLINTPERSRLLIAGGEFIPPDEGYPYYCYAMGGSVMDFDDEDPNATDLGPIMGIELRDLNEGRIQAICKCHEIPQLVEFLHELRTQVIRVFNPMYSVAVDEKILARLDEIANNLRGRLDDIKQRQIAIFRRIDNDTQQTLTAILREVREQKINQGEMRNTVNSIRRVLKFVQENGIPVNDKEIRQTLSDIHQALNSDISMSQKLELSLPVIPLLLNYKFEFDMGVDLAALWRDVVKLIQE